MALASTRVVDTRTGVEALGSGGGIAGTDPPFGPRTGVEVPESGGWLVGTDLRAGTRTGIDAPGSHYDQTCLS